MSSMLKSSSIAFFPANLPAENKPCSVYLILLILCWTLYVIEVDRSKKRISKTSNKPADIPTNTISSLPSKQVIKRSWAAVVNFQIDLGALLVKILSRRSNPRIEESEEQTAKVFGEREQISIIEDEGSNDESNE